jgi:membrane dipeptidase
MIDTAGSEHVGIGTDFDGFTDPPDDLRDASELPRLTQRLLAEGFDVETLTRLWGGNALRALRQGWGKRL